MGPLRRQQLNQMRLSFRTKCLIIPLLSGLGFFITCAKKGNVFDCNQKTAHVPCEQADPLELAKKALNEGDADKAIEILTAYQLKHPDVYSYYPLWSSAYAMKAGLDIFNLFSVSGTDNKSVFDLIGDFLPSPDSMSAEDYQLSLDNMNIAKETLLAMPEAERSDTVTYSYAASASLQLTLYSTAYAAMYLNQFVAPDPTDPTSVSVEQLETMSPEDAATVIDNLVEAAAQDPNSPINGQLQEAIAAIDQQPGDNTRDRLINYIQASHQ